MRERSYLSISSLWNLWQHFFKLWSVYAFQLMSHPVWWRSYTKLRPGWNDGICSAYPRSTHDTQTERRGLCQSITSARSLKQQQDVYMQLLMQQENNFKGFVQILVVSTNKRDLQGVDYKVQRQMHRHQYHVWISLINDWWESRLPQASIQTE